MNKTLKWLLAVSGGKKAGVVWLVLCQALSGGLGVLFALLLKSTVDSAASGDSASLKKSVILLVCLALSQIALAALIRWLKERTKADIENIFKQRLFGAILSKDFGTVSAVHTGEWLNRLTGDTAIVADGFAEIIPGVTGTVVRIVAAIAVIIALDTRFVFILLPGTAAVIVLSYAFRRVLKRLHKNIRESDGRLRVFLQEHISSLMTVKSFAAEEKAYEEALEKTEDHKKARMKKLAFSNISNIGFNAAIHGMFIVGIIYCAYGIIGGTVSYGTLTAIMQLINSVRSPIANVSGYLPRYYAAVASAERLMEIESFEDDITPESPEKINRFYESEFEKLGLEDVSFTYPSGSETAVFEHLDIEIRKGETVAFTGRSGCGKSTVLKILMCMYPVSGGRRFLNSGGLTAAHRRLFAYVPQGNGLLSGTVRECVSFADPSGADDDERIARALQIACADDFVTDYDAPLGEGGAGFSEGQMQRLAIARAIFAGCPVLLLDEATASLDETTEKKLLENLRSLTDKTVIIVTHRRAALSICDRVFDFEQLSGKE